MLSIQQVIKTLRKLQNNNTVVTTTNSSSDLFRSLKHVAAAANVEGIPQLAAKAISTAVIINVPKSFMTSLAHSNDEAAKTSKVEKSDPLAMNTLLPEQHKQMNVCSRSNMDNETHISCLSASTNSSNKRNDEDDDDNDNNISSSQLPKQQTLNHHASHNECFSLYSPLNVNGSKDFSGNVKYSNTQDSHIKITEISTKATSPLVAIEKTKYTTTKTTKSVCQKHHQHHQPSQQHHQPNHHHHHHQQQQSPNHFSNNNQRSQRIQNFFRQQIFNQFQQFHTQPTKYLQSNHKQTQFAMSSLAAEPLVTPTPCKDDHHHCQPKHQQQTASSCDDESSSNAQSVCNQQQESTKTSSGKPCFNSGLGDIIQFMELIGNLKHTKRTGWVLRDINDCESISGHMYRMSILTFLLDGSEGLNQIRCMELALVHDLAESLVGDITPFCGISKENKKAMELKAMEDICKLIEPRGKRIMELFEEYENGQSPESRFVKDLDRLDMVMQAYEYEKRDNCLLKHQEFFDSTEGKFNHPFVKKLVGEIYEQREKLAKAKGATPPPKVAVPNMDDPKTYASSKANGHHHSANGTTTSNGCTEEPSKTS